VLCDRNPFELPNSALSGAFNQKVLFSCQKNQVGRSVPVNHHHQHRVARGEGAAQTPGPFSKNGQNGIPQKQTFFSLIKSVYGQQANLL